MCANNWVRSFFEEPGCRVTNLRSVGLDLEAPCANSIVLNMQQCARKLSIGTVVFFRFVELLVLDLEAPCANSIVLNMQQCARKLSNGTVVFFRFVELLPGNRLLDIVCLCVRQLLARYSIGCNTQIGICRPAGVVVP